MKRDYVSAKKNTATRNKILLAVYMVAVVLSTASVLFMHISTQRQSLQAAVAEKVIRFHVVANSDTEQDQRLKLKVRDRVGNYLAYHLENADSIEESRSIIHSHLDKIENLAERTLKEEGVSQEVEVKMTHTDFPEKKYGEYVFAAGTYEALEIVLGDGEGKNWWCVMYPNLCFSNAVESDSLKKELTSEEYESIIDNGEYVIRFKLFDIICEEAQKWKFWLKDRGEKILDDERGFGYN